MRDAETKAVPSFYYLLLMIQTALAVLLFAWVLPLFLRMIESLGDVQDVPARTMAWLTATAVCMQCVYWYRYQKVPIKVPFHNVVVGHAVIFSSQASFFFSGGLFSVIFFRHLPALEKLPSSAQIVTTGLVIFIILFASFCYSLELDRFGKAMEQRGTSVPAAKALETKPR